LSTDTARTSSWNGSSEHALWDKQRQRIFSASASTSIPSGWFGHVSLDTTNISAEIDFAMKANALAKCEPARNTTAAKRWRNQPALMDFLRAL
jgi:integrase/recombinase XerD